jgi:hypothetical protein
VGGGAEQGGDTMELTEFLGDQHGDSCPLLNDAVVRGGGEGREEAVGSGTTHNRRPMST